MRVALIQHAEDNIDCHHRSEEQERLRLRALLGLARLAAELCPDIRRQAGLRLGGPDGCFGLSD